LDNIPIPHRIVHGDFTGWLVDAMNSRRMSARMVGLRTGVNHSTVTRLVNGDRQPTLATAMALFRLFGSDVENPVATGFLVPDGSMSRNPGRDTLGLTVQNERADSEA
jgi:hypothetical protein